MSRSRLADARGAVLVHTAVALVGLLVFTASTVDYGVLWVSRGQAQNAADAAALGAAMALSAGQSNDAARAAGVTLGQANLVWGQAPSVTTADILIPCGLSEGTCVRANVYRNQARGNALPTFFGRLAGVTSQGVRATATVALRGANAATCMKPWAVPDKWIDHTSSPQTFDKYSSSGTLLQPYDTTAGAGYTLAAHRGAEITIEVGDPQATIKPGLFFPVTMPWPGQNANQGNQLFGQNITQCNPTPVAIGDWLPTNPGGSIVNTKRFVDDLIAQDAAAYWDATAGRIQNTAYPKDGMPMSPRVVAVAAFNPEQFLDSGDRSRVQVSNILGLFIKNTTYVGTGQNRREAIVGVFVAVPALTANGSATATNSFVQQAVVMR